jgi:hypothetical protein
MKKTPPESYLKMMEELEKKGGIVERDVNKEKYRYKDTRLSKDKDLTPENVKAQIKENREMQSLLDDAEKFEAKNKTIREKEALKIPSDTIYDKKGNLTDLSGKPKFTKTRSLLGILPAAAATALSMFAPESKASTVAKTAARVIDEGDPTSLLFPEGAGEGEDREVQKLNEENKKKFFDNLMKEGMKNQKIRSEKETELKKEVEPIVKILGGDSDISSSKALKSSGEKPSPDLEEMEDSLNYEDYLKKKKRQLGY